MLITDHELTRFTDDVQDADAIEAGAWDTPRYGRGDRLGSYHEVGPDTAQRALSLLDLSRPVRSFSLGETLYVGYPGWGERAYSQQLVVNGYQPSPDFEGVVLAAEASGRNRASTLEEVVSLSFNLGSKVNGLAHVGVGRVYYGGRRIDDLLATGGVTDLDTTEWGAPLVTRGYVIDVLSYLLESAPAGSPALAAAADGRAVLAGDHRITLEELLGAIERQSLPSFEPGDAIFLRTGWRRLLRTEPKRYLRGSPGVWLRETRWLASFRPAMVGTDSWCWGSTSSSVTQGNLAACHQELLVHEGVRIAESMALDELSAAGVDRFVLIHNPIRAEGAVSTNAAPTALANVEPGA